MNQVVNEDCGSINFPLFRYVVNYLVIYLQINTVLEACNILLEWSRQKSSLSSNDSYKIVVWLHITSSKPKQ